MCPNKKRTTACEDRSTQGECHGTMEGEMEELAASPGVPRISRKPPEAGKRQEDSPLQVSEGA